MIDVFYLSFDDCWRYDYYDVVCPFDVDVFYVMMNWNQKELLMKNEERGIRTENVNDFDEKFSSFLVNDELENGMVIVMMI